MVIRSWMHPIILLLVPSVLLFFFGASITVIWRMSNDSHTDWAMVLSGMIWLGLFSAGVLGVIFHVVSANRMVDVNAVSPVMPHLDGITNIEYTKARQWLRLGIITTDSLKEMTRKANGPTT